MGLFPFECAVASASIQNRESVPDRPGMVDVVSDENHADPFELGLDDILEDHSCFFYPESRCWFVQNQYFRPEINRSSNRYRLAFAPGKCPYRLIGVPDFDANLS